MTGRSSFEVVLFDAYGTLLYLDDPVGALHAGLERIGLVCPTEDVARAFRREVAFYRVHHDRGRDAASLDELRSECAAVFAESLPVELSVAVARDVLLGALRYRVFPEVRPVLAGLRGRGLRLGVVSNWDASLPEVLAELGLVGEFEVVVASALAGARKPDPVIFRTALAELGVAAPAAVHIGDDPELDGRGAVDAGLRFVHLDRSDSTPGCIDSLFALECRLALSSHPQPPARRRP